MEELNCTNNSTTNSSEVSPCELGAHCSRTNEETSSLDAKNANFDQKVNNVEEIPVREKLLSDLDALLSGSTISEDSSAEIKRILENFHSLIGKNCTFSKNEPHFDQNESDFEEDQLPSMSHFGDFEEGYESDLPMVRASMRKLRPVLCPIPTNSHLPQDFDNNLNVPSSSSSSSRVNNLNFSVNDDMMSSSISEEAEILSSSLNAPLINIALDSSLNSNLNNNIESTSLINVQNSSTISNTNNELSEVRVAPSTETNSTTCSTFRPSADLVFANLQESGNVNLSPLVDLTDNSTNPNELSESGNESNRAETTNVNRTQVRSSTEWPHRLSSVLALVGCTIGLTNISRFSLLSLQYGANFTLQFSLLSILLGIPLLSFHMSIGQYLRAGIVDMWKISPIFKGIGVGLIISQMMVGIYTAVGVSWLFSYFRDSFIPKYDQFRWGKCFRDFRDCEQLLYNNTQLAETVPDYFNGVVLQRSTPEFPSPFYGSSGLKFTVIFNLAVVWMLIFVSLGKGIKSYGKAIHGLIIIPILSLLVLTSKMVGLVPSEEVAVLFGSTSWGNFFFNSHTWIIAAREVFFTWGLLGACVMQITSHNRSSHSLKSDAAVVVFITTFVLLLSSFLGSTCHYIINAHGYDYIPSSFESEEMYRFLIRKSGIPTVSPRAHYNPNVQYTSFLMGVKISQNHLSHLYNFSNNKNLNMVSGYQAMRLATELFPSSMALLASQGFSPFWTVLFYFTLILFGLGQQVAIWYCVINGIIGIKYKLLKSWETTITFGVCAIGFILGMPLCTEYGIFVEYFLDYTIGSGWWIMVLYLLELVAVFVVRGAPYSGENIVTILYGGHGKITKALAQFYSFIWNVILPVALLVLSITSFKDGNVRELYDWNPTQGYVFWPSWTRELGSILQLLPILCVPFIAIIQSARYLSAGPTDFFERLQLLYRPHSRGLTLTNSRGSTVGFPTSPQTESRNEDPPPKYTPPPSYSAVSGAKIAKFLRNSIRRSLRRLTGAPPLPPPPPYSSVIIEIHNSCPSSSSSPPQFLINSLPILIPQNHNKEKESSSQLNHMSRFHVNVGEGGGRSKNMEFKRELRRISSDITPSQVAKILRASFRREESEPEPFLHLAGGVERGSDSLFEPRTSWSMPRNQFLNFNPTYNEHENRVLDPNLLGVENMNNVHTRSSSLSVPPSYNSNSSQ